MARARALPPVDAPVTPAELVRLLERLGYDPTRTGRVTLSATTGGVRVTTTYVATIAAATP